MSHHEMDHSNSSPLCSPQMLLNTDYRATCIVSSAFRVHDLTSLVFYMLCLFALGIFYEWLRLQPAVLEARFRSSDSVLRGKARVEATTLSHAGGNADARTRAPLLQNAIVPSLYPSAGYTTSQKLMRSAMYTSIVALSFVIMLVIMTYNTYLCASVLAGAFTGHFIFHSDQVADSTDRGIACH